MTIGSWVPESSGQPPQLDDPTWQALQQVAGDSEESVTPEMLEAAKLTDSQWVMRLPASDWQVADELDDAALVSLVRFFTLVEYQVPGWDSGKESPVIPLVKLLKRRDAFDAELRKWIKRNTDNRYLPNGSAL